MLPKIARSSRVTLRKSCRVVLGILYLTHSARAEEKYIWENATVLDPSDFNTDYSPPDNLIHSTSFKEIVRTLSNLANQSILID